MAQISFTNSFTYFSNLLLPHPLLSLGKSILIIFHLVFSIELHAYHVGNVHETAINVVRLAKVLSSGLLSDAKVVVPVLTVSVIVQGGYAKMSR